MFKPKGWDRSIIDKYILHTLLHRTVKKRAHSQDDEERFSNSNYKCRCIRHYYYIFTCLCNHCWWWIAECMQAYPWHNHSIFAYLCTHRWPHIVECIGPFVAVNFCAVRLIFNSCSDIHWTCRINKPHFISLFNYIFLSQRWCSFLSGHFWIHPKISLVRTSDNDCVAALQFAFSSLSWLLYI